ncbi:C25 family cysteine peptidase, partial [Calditrichota bacterium]
MLNLKTGDRYKSGRYKILVKEDGLYQITYQDLLDAGMDVNSLNPRKLRLFNKGQEIAIYFKGAVDLSFDQGDYFEFWGEKNQNTFLNQYPDQYQDPFTDVNVYWLENSTSNGLRMVEESGALTVSNPANYVVPIFYKEKIHFENDHYYEHFGQPSANLDLPSYTLDLWYYDSGISAVGSRTYNAYIPHPWETGANSVFIKAMMRGKSYYNYDTNRLESHQAEIWLNDKKVGESGVWKNQAMHVIENSGGLGLSQSDIHHGDNDFRIVMDQTGVLDVVMLNWFDISYLRKYRADNNFINFRKQEGVPPNYTFQFEIDGFNRSDIEVYKKGVSKIVNSRIDFYTNQDDNYSSYRLSFQDKIFYSGIEYIAITKDKKKKPISIVEDLPWFPDATNDVSLLDQSNKAEYLIITQELLYDNVLQLKQYLEQKGVSVEVVKVQDIYDEFNYGIKSPLAIKDFLTYVYESWDQSTQLYYVNLIGAASENYKTASTSKPDLVPTFLFQTKKYGSSGSDFYYTLISGGENDIVPDLVISRIPAKNNSEFLNYFDKLQNYESAANAGVWANKALMISGNDASTEELNVYPHAFRSQNQRIINYKIPDAYFSRKINTVRDDDTTRYDPNFGGTTDLINYWDDGLLYINFFGHGGGGIWADVQLFNLNNIDRLNNGYLLPFVTSMTCFTGAFENKSLSGIAEKLITIADRGAIGVYAST